MRHVRHFHKWQSAARTAELIQPNLVRDHQEVIVSCTPGLKFVIYDCFVTDVMVLVCVYRLPISVFIVYAVPVVGSDM